MSDNHNHDEHKHHVTPFPLYHKVFAGLIGLTILTVVTSLFDFGMFNMVVAMGIATLKAGLVIAIFMQLKYDNLFNKVTFLCSFVFLAIFIIITASDLLFRPNVAPLQIDTSANAAAVAGPDVLNKLRISTPDQIAKGKTLYAVQCATCHGANGQGDGAAAAALNPKPRDFTSGIWKFGASPTRVFTTITKGSPGTGMAAYAGLSAEDRYALVHYVRSLSPKTPADTDEDLKAAGLLGGSSVVEKVQQTAHIDVVLENMAERDQVPFPEQEVRSPNHPGAKIFSQQCAQCHGLSAMGAPVVNIGLNPPVQFISKSWVDAQGSWVGDRGAFVNVVSHGFPGSGMPGMSNFSNQEWSDLHAYVKLLTTK
ncbi:MAG: c-type cytochrome [Oligoflexia bacterium]|nr:c-type cytochrome [Oligoflexia bacterium]